MKTPKIPFIICILILFQSLIINSSLLIFSQSTQKIPDSLSDPHTDEQMQSIFGIRWFLGDYWQFTYSNKTSSLQQNNNNNSNNYNDQNKSHQMFILMFNSKQDLDDEIFLKINNNRYGCYERFLEIQSVGRHHYQFNKNASKQGQKFTNYLYKCIVSYRIFKQSKVKYQIISGWAIFQGQKDSAIIKKYKEDVLFQSQLRLPQNIKNIDMIWVADWGLISENAKKNKGYIDIMPSLQQSLKNNENIGLMIFGGDLAYDLQTQNYINMLTYMQSITSQIAMIVTPGNHESVYHEDSFELFVQSFYTPMWYKYFNYFTFVVLQQQKTVIIGYNPQQYIFKNINNINRLNKQLSQIFSNQLTSSISSYISSHYNVIAFSHYPIYCSYPSEHLSSCDNQQLLKPFINKFKQIGLDLYISGHLHNYQRTKQICNEKQYIVNNKEEYQMKCPIYVVSGVSGNQDYVAMKKDYELRQYSQKQLFGTGYDIISLISNNITFKHYNMYNNTNAKVTDQFTLYNNIQQYNQNIINTSKLIIIGQIILIILIISLIVYLIYRFKNKKSQMNNNKKDHVEMVEENFQTPERQPYKGDDVSK